MAEVIELPEDYYLTHFERVLDHVEARYRHLLRAGERDVLGRWRGLERPARMLYLRLINRKGPILRVSSLVYPEIGAVEEPLEALERAGLCELDEALWARFDREVLLRTLTAAELKRVAARAGIGVPKGTRKDALVALLEAAEDPLLWAVDRFVAARQADVFGLTRILFFGNVEQGMTTFIVHELEHVRFPSYRIADELPLWDSREQVDDYVEAALARDRWEWGPGPASVEEAREGARRALEIVETHGAQPAHRRTVSPAHAYARVALIGARELERAGEAEEATRCYERLVARSPDLDVRVKAADRLGLMAQRGSAEAGFAAACEALQGEDLDALAAHRLAYRRARLGLGADPGKALNKPRTVELELEAAQGPRGVKARYLGVEGASLTVEEAALERLGPGVRAENALFLAFFGLLCWEELFLPVPGMFQQPFQGAPLDIDSPHFYGPRRAAFEGRFEALRGADLARLVRQQFASHQGEANRFVRWGLWTGEALAEIAERLGAEALVAVLERIARSPKRHGSGMPDLLVWPEDRVALVEVKGPGDSVHLEQKLWHDYLLRRGLDVRIAKVRRR